MNYKKKNVRDKKEKMESFLSEKMIIKSTKSE